MRRYTDVVQDLNGNAIDTATVQVFEAFSTQTTPVQVQIYDADEAIPANEIDQASTDSTGTFFFYVIDGRYDIRAVYLTETGSVEKIWLDQLISESGSTGAGDSSSINAILTQDGEVLVDQDGSVSTQDEAS